MKEALKRIEQTITNRIKDFMLKNNGFKAVFNIAKMKDNKVSRGKDIS